MVTPSPLLRFLTAAAILLVGTVATAAPRIWFVDAARSDGDGSAASPFATIAAATAAASADDVIYLFRGTYREHATLGERQLLAGHGAAIREELARRGIAMPADLPSLAAQSVIESSEGDALTLANGSSVIGVRLRTASGRALVATNAAGEIQISDVPIEAAKGTAVAIEGGDAKIVFTRSPNTAATGTALSIRNRTGGSVRWSEGSTITVSAGVMDAVVLQSNQGEYTFEAPLRLTTSAARALVIRSSSRVSISSPASVIATTRATAVDIADTGISIFLQSVSVDGTGATIARGVSLENAPGTFRLDGGIVRNIGQRGISIVRSSGVTLQNIVLEKSAAGAKATPRCTDLQLEQDIDCHAAIHLVEVTNVLLRKVKIDDSGQAGIFGDRITDLTLDGVTIESAGDEPGEHGIMIRGLHGRSVIFDSKIIDSAARQLFVLNRDGEGALEIRRSRFDGGPPPSGQQGVLVQLEKDAKFSLVIDDADLVQHFSNALHVVAGDASQLELFVNNTRFADIGSAINLVADGKGQLQYRITDNRIRDAKAAAINVSLGVTGGSSSGTISGNVIGESGAAGSGAKCGTCTGIAVVATRGGSSRTTIVGNTIREVDGFGIRVNARGNSQMAISISGNTIADPHGAEVLSAIALQAGAGSSDTARLCADVVANRISGAWDPQGGGAAIVLTSRGDASIALAGVPEEGSAAVTKHLPLRNNEAKSRVTGNVTAVKTCN